MKDRMKSFCKHCGFPIEFDIRSVDVHFPPDGGLMPRLFIPQIVIHATARPYDLGVAEPEEGSVHA